MSVRRRRTDGRAAFENIPAGILPRTFEISVVDEQDNPQKRLRLEISVDGGEEESFDTDDAGTIKVRNPQNELRIKLTNE